MFPLNNIFLFNYLYVTCNQRNYLDTRTHPEFDFRGRSCRTNRYEFLFCDKADDDVVVLVQDVMARIHDELDEVVEVLVMRKGLEYVGPKRGEPNNQHERLFSVKVGEGGDGNLLHRGSDRRTESHLLLCGRIVDDRVPAMTVLLPRTSQHVPPGNSVAFLHWGIPNDDERKGLVERVRPSNLHHVLDSNHLLFFSLFAASFSALDFCVLYLFFVPCV
jgi:hypothetical protein